MSHSWIDEMIRPQQQLSGSLTNIGLTKIQSFLLWKFVHFHAGVLEGVFPISLENWS